eukprot:CAMPEP_0173377732 /NCGR_PEP_ID=MMETSP1356-20130122/1003_1 /TAXON_ID=77927 ORGANISM="Hemiselmis virescens, Strain PCC157" /NCGR_SAMPLE_ID=MMETSP1356 /ASSEMBLY_ACC=CAM_ASM_000847 /LENGTH=72 /DNA_ID=CAMNT_0014330597 /DNA_START=22 /DNA_END=237 /DNA_ORIENTATION=-
MGARAPPDDFTGKEGTGGCEESRARPRGGAPMAPLGGEAREGCGRQEARLGASSTRTPIAEGVTFHSLAGGR